MCIFQVSITVFKDFSRLFHTYDHFQGLENFYIKFQDFPYFSRIRTNPIERGKGRKGGEKERNEETEWTGQTPPGADWAGVIKATGNSPNSPMPAVIH